MPRGKKPTYALAEDGAGRLAPVRVDDHRGDFSDVPSLQDSEAWDAASKAAFTLLMDRTDGWLRAAPDKDGKSNHFKWKFNSAKWPNHYVYYNAPIGCWQEGICGLYMKVKQVDEGVRKPTFDTYYNNALLD